MDFNRKVMVVSTTVLGVSLASFLLAWMVLGDNTDDDLRSLLQTNIIFRHGAKFPDKIYEKDSHLLKDIQNTDPGALSLPGSLQSYNLGKNLRHRYLKLLPKNGFYSNKIIQVKSSWKDRTISSAQAFLAGFMPPLEYSNPLPIPWQPVPIYSIPRNRDDIIAQKRPCPKYDEVYTSIMKSKEMQAIDKENKNLYRILSVNTKENISSLLDVELWHNTIEAEKAAGWDIPDWTENIFPDKTLPLSERYLRLITETPFMKRIKAGPLITEILDTMLNRKNLASERSISIYSGHDVTLVNIMNAMQIIEQTTSKPDYAAALAIELHSSREHIDDNDVKMYYYFNSEDKYPKAIEIPGCKEPCSLTKFTKIMNGLIVNDYDKLCETV